MEVILPHRVEYLVEGPVSITEVVESLQAQQRLITELGEVFELILDGVHVQRAELRVRAISVGSLKEAFFVALFLVYQEELRREIPPMVEAWLGLPVDDRYDTLVTVGVLFLLYYGADYAYKRLIDQLGSARLANQLNQFASELAHASGKSVPEIRKLIDDYFGRRGRLKELAKASVKFFRPSRNQNNDPILIGDRRVEPQAIRDVPNQVDLDELDSEEHSVPFYGHELRYAQRTMITMGRAGAVS